MDRGRFIVAYRQGRSVEIRDYEDGSRDWVFFDAQSSIREIVPEGRHDASILEIKGTQPSICLLT